MRNAERSLGHRLLRLAFVFASAAGSWIGPTSASALPLLGATLTWDADGLGSGSVNLLSLPGITCDTTSKTGSCNLPSSWTPVNGYYTVNSFSSSWNPDPFVTNDFNVTNNTAGTLIFDVTVTSPVVLTGPQTAMSGSLGITLTNTPAQPGGGSLTDAGASVYRALIDGGVVRTLFDSPYTLTCVGSTCSAVDTDSFGNPVPEIGPQANADIGIRIRFALGPGDRAGVTSVFNIEAVPEPDTALLVIAGLLGLAGWRRGRERCSVGHSSLSAPHRALSNEKGTVIARLLQISALSLLLATSTMIPSLSNATTFTYTALLAPDTGGTGSGSVQVDWDDALNTMRVQASFSGLSGTTTIAHIHAPTASPGTGTANVATQVPSFILFPVGVTAGTFDQTLDMTLATSYNPGYITSNGGTVAGAEAALKLALDVNEAYFNIHTSTFPSGEIRGFPLLVPEPGTALLVGAGLLGLAGWRRVSA